MDVMSMTESEREKIISDIRDGYIDEWDNLTIDELFKQIESEHKEIQQYRVIGTATEFQELKEKATAKKPIYSDFDENEDEEIIPFKAVCPVCGHEFEFGTWNDEQNHHCECGQRMLWD